MQKIKINDIELKPNQENTHLRIEFYYDKGGANYFTGGIKKRGYYLSVCPIKKSINSYSYIGFTGTYKFIKEAKRFSQKEFDNLLPTLTEDTKLLIDYVSKENNISL